MLVWSAALDALVANKVLEVTYIRISSNKQNVKSIDRIVSKPSHMTSLGYNTILVIRVVFDFN